MNKPRKNVLVISYYFPPSGGSGVQRPLKFVKYLRNYGCEPIVLTARGADYPAYDDSLFAEIPPGVQVYRAKIFEPYRLYRKLTGRAANESTDIATLTLQRNRPLSERVSEWIRAAFFVPDARIGWLFFAYQLGKKIIKEQKIDIIFSSAPPYTTHLIGLMLKRSTGLPWVADFRDSWIGWLSTPQWRPKVSRAAEMRMERSVLAHANRILTVSKGVRDDLWSRHPELHADHWQLLRNGFDDADFAGVTPKPKEKKIVFTYTGSLYGHRNPEHLIRALENLQRQHCELSNKIKLRFIGRLAGPIIERIENSAVRKQIEIVPYVPHRESLAYLLSSDVSVLIIDDAPVNRGILTGKLFEYIAVGNPILALAPEGEAAELIREYNLGYVVPPKDAKAIEGAIVSLVQSKASKADRLQVDKNVRLKFDRKTQTESLARIFDDVLNRETK